MKWRRVLLATCVAPVITSVSCGTSAAGGTATPTTEASTAENSSVSPTMSSASSPSRALSLDSVDVCAIVPSSVVTQLGYRPPISPQQQVGVTKYVCGYRVTESGVGTSLFADTGTGSDQYNNPGPGKTITDTQVAGSHALSIQDQKLAACTISVDVAPAQSLTAVTTTDILTDPVGPLCDRSDQFVSAAIAALEQK